MDVSLNPSKNANQMTMIYDDDGNIVIKDNAGNYVFCLEMLGITDYNEKKYNFTLDDSGYWKINHHNGTNVWNSLDNGLNFNEYNDHFEFVSNNNDTVYYSSIDTIERKYKMMAIDTTYNLWISDDISIADLNNIRWKPIQTQKMVSRICFSNGCAMGLYNHYHNSNIFFMKQDLSIIDITTNNYQLKEIAFSYDPVGRTSYAIGIEFSGGNTINLCYTQMNFDVNNIIWNNIPITPSSFNNSISYSNKYCGVSFEKVISIFKIDDNGTPNNINISNVYIIKKNK
jgi:hypothetical protein